MRKKVRSISNFNVLNLLMKGKTVSRKLMCAVLGLFKTSKRSVFGSYLVLNVFPYRKTLYFKRVA